MICIGISFGDGSDNGCIGSLYMRINYDYDLPDSPTLETGYGYPSGDSAIPEGILALLQMEGGDTMKS